MKKILFISIIFILVTFFQNKAIAQWVKTNGIQSGNAYALTSNGINLFAAVYGTGIFRSNDNGSNWTKVDSSLTEASSLAAIGSTLFAGSYGAVVGSVFRSMDNGANWTNLLTTQWQPCFGVMGTTLFAGPCGGGPIRRSTDYGDSWESANDGITTSWVYAFGTFNSKIFVAGDYGHLFQSDDYGDHWFETGYSGNLILSINVNESAIYVGTQSEGTVYCSVYKSTDNGQNWTNTGFDNLALAGCDIRSILSVGDKIFISTNGYGVFLYTNDVPNWTNVGLESRAVWQILISGDEMIAGTSFGVWKRALSEMITAVEPNKNNLPTKYLLSQNYPNPFNPTTKISYAIQQNSFVELKVFNLLGQEIVTLVNQEKSAGTYEVNFDASNLPSGVYIYRMKAGDPSTGSGQVYVQTRKMVLLK